jgi:hypothetical protein
VFSLRNTCTAPRGFNTVPLRHPLKFLHHIAIWPQEKAWNFLDTNVHVLLENHRFVRATQQLVQVTRQKIPDSDVGRITTVQFYVLLTVHIGSVLVKNQLDAKFFFHIYLFYSSSLHVSSTPVLIIRKITCINLLAKELYI